MILDKDAEIRARSPECIEEDYDVDIRRLVALMNRWPGIRTIYSCAGHAVEAFRFVVEARIHFVVDTQATLRDFMDVVPEREGWTHLGHYSFLYHHAWIDVTTLSEQPRLDGRAVVYRLNIVATPLAYQRTKIEAIENALAAHFVKQHQSLTPSNPTL